MYSPPSGIRNFSSLRKVALWAGGLGVLQSLIWIGLTLTGIFAYNCFIDLPQYVTFGSIMDYVFFTVYFKGNCNPDVYQQIDTTLLDDVYRILDPTQLLIWICVYLGVAVCWLIASVLIMTYLKKDCVPTTVGVVAGWVSLTTIVSLMDLALGIIFGLDYLYFHARANSLNLDSGQAGAIDPNGAQVVAGQVAAISLMIISLKGFVLWLINVGLVLYFVLQAICIMRDKDGNDTLFTPRKDSNDILTTRPPINAYDNNGPTSYSNQAFTPDTRSNGTVELNEEAIARAARMSTDPSLQDRRFRNLDNFQQYPPPRISHRPESTRTPESVGPVVQVSAFPEPDYSPPMTRANQGGQNGILRNQRYH